MTEKQDDIEFNPEDSIPNTPETPVEATVVKVEDIPELKADSKSEVVQTEPPVVGVVDTLPTVEEVSDTSKDTPVETPNAIQTEEYSTTKKDLSKYGYSFPLPTIGLYNFNTKIRKFNNLELDKNDPKLKKWKKVHEDSIEYHTVGGIYQSRFTDSNSTFSQGVETKEGKLASISNLKFKETEGELKGELAILKVTKTLGLGEVVSIPLPHSGIWVTVKPPNESDLIDFYNGIFRDKIILGRATFGLTLTNFSVYINNKLFDFIIKHVHSTNYQEIHKQTLKDIILLNDFPILAWGFACAMYPNGFDYQRACVADVESCSHVARAVLNMTKLLWVDNPSLTEAQRIILSENRPNKLSMESYKKFMAEHVRVTSTTIDINENVKFKLRVPTFNEYTDDGLTWVNKINSAIDTIIDDGSDEDRKTEMLDQYVKASILRQFSHFVDYIEVDSSVISDRDTINSVLEVFSSQDEARTTITNGILKFKSDTCLALIGIPDFNCPSCKKPQNDTPINDKFVNVIPLDVMNLFFTLITLRISKIAEREV